VKEFSKLVEAIPLYFLPNSLCLPSFPFPSPATVAVGPGWALKLPQWFRSEPGRQTHFDFILFQIIEFGDVSGANDFAGNWTTQTVDSLRLHQASLQHSLIKPTFCVFKPVFSFAVRRPLVLSNAAKKLPNICALGGALFNCEASWVLANSDDVLQVHVHVQRKLH